MTRLTSMNNIGKEIAKKLSSVGITSSEELHSVGYKRAFRKLKEAYPSVCLVHLYALFGAVNNIDYNQIPDNIKKELKDYYDNL